MKNYKYALSSIILLILVFFTYLKFLSNNDILEVSNDIKIFNVDIKKIKSKVNNPIFVVLNYTKLDCESCIRLGYDIMNDLFNKNYNRNIEFVIVGQTESIQNDSLLYNNNVPILMDSSGFIQKNLNYISSPIIVFSTSDSTGIAVRIKNNVKTEEKIREIAERNGIYIK